MNPYPLLLIPLFSLAIVGCDQNPVASRPANDQAPVAKGTTTIPPVVNPHPSSPNRTIDALSTPQEQQVIAAVATILGKTPGAVALDDPIIDDRKGLGEFELLEILLELEDRFDTEISEDTLETATGGRFDDVQKSLTPRQLFQVVSMARRAPSPTEKNSPRGN